MNTDLQGHEPDENLESDALRMSLHLFVDDDVVVADDLLQESVRERVTELLTRNPERLMSILYRIDVPEDKVQHVMKNAPVASIAIQLATLIIDRMREKILTRQLYKQQSSNT